MDRKLGILLLTLFPLSVLGTVSELILTAHTKGWQVVPLVLLPLSVVVFVWFVKTRSVGSRRCMQGTMISFFFAGVLGIALHFGSNEEFAKELHPGLVGVEMFTIALKGAAPILAPGIMIQLGILGMAITFLEKPFVISQSNKEAKNVL